MQCPLWECGAAWRAALLVKAGRLAEAKVLYESLFRAQPHPSYKLEAAAFLAEQAEAAGDKAGAIPYVRALLDSAPQDPALHARLGGLLEDTGGTEEAKVLALWLWTRAPALPPSAAFFKARPQWKQAFAGLPPAVQLERLRALASEGDMGSLGAELPHFVPSGAGEAGWASFLKGRLQEGQGRAAEALKSYEAVGSPQEARIAAITRTGFALPKAGATEKAAEAVETLVMGLPEAAEGRQKALVNLLKWRIRQPSERRAVALAEALIAFGQAQPEACEYLYDKGWDRALAGDLKGAQGVWRILLQHLAPDSDYRHAAAYSLYRRGLMRPSEAKDFKDLTLREDRYGYFGYRLRGAPPPAGVAGILSPAEPPAPPGSHLAKGRLLMDLGLPRDAAREVQLALDEESDPAARSALLWTLTLAKTSAMDYSGAIRTARALYPRVFNENGDALPRSVWRVLYPAPFREAVLTSADSRALPYLLVCSLIRQESLWDPDALSRSGARGLMQLMPGTASTLARRYKLGFDPPACYTDPSWNTRAGCAFLRELLNRYHGRVELALAAYNAGPGRVDDWLARPRCPKEPDLFIESIPFKETRSYVRRILLNCWEYSRLYSEFPAPLAPGALQMAALAPPQASP